MTPGEYGHLVLLITIAQLMFIFTSGWSNGAIINLGSKSFAEKGSYIDIVWYRTVIVLASLVVISVIFYFLKFPIQDFIVVRNNYALVYILFIGYVFYDYASQLLYPGNKDLIQSFTELIATLSLVVLILMFVKDIQSYVYIYTGVFFCFFITVIIIFLKYFGRKRINFVKNEFNFVLKYSSWQVLSIVGIYVMSIGINYIFVFNKVDIVDIGLYNFSHRLFLGFSSFFALFGILIPKWVHNPNKDKFAYQLKRKLVYTIVILSSLYLCVGVLLKPVLMLLEKMDYIKSVEYYFYLFPAFVFMCYGNLMNMVAMNTDYFRRAQFAIVGQGVALILFAYPLVHYFGVIGGIVAVTISFFVGSVYFYALRKYLFAK